MERLIDIETDDLRLLRELLDKHLPGKTVWAYGSRVKWKTDKVSDLDLVVWGAAFSQIANARDAFLESNLPFTVQLLSWEDVPDEFRVNIRKKYVVLQEGDNMPEGWREVKLGDLVDEGFCLIKNELRQPLSSKERSLMKGDYPYYGAAKQIDSISNYKLEGFHLLIAEDGTVTSNGKNPMLQLVDGKFWVSNHAHIISSKDKGRTLLLFYMLSNIDISPYITGAVQPKLSKNNLLKIKILLPPLREQKAIAEILSSLDDKIDLLRRQNETLEAMAQTLFRQWFVEPCKNSLPEGWKVGNLSDEFDFTMGQSPPGNSYNERAEGVPMFQGNADFGFRFPTNRIYTTEPKRFANRFETLISVRAPVGEQNMAREKSCIGRGVAAFRHRQNPDYYTYTYFKLKSLMREIKRFNAMGTVFGSVSKADFQQLETVLPPKVLVRQFEHKAGPLNGKVVENCNQIDILAGLRDILLPNLMSGEVRTQSG